MSVHESPEPNPNPNPNPNSISAGEKRKRKRNLPGTPDPEAEVVALSPRTLLTASSFTCEVCGREFRRDQNLQIHRRGHNLPWRATPSSKDAEVATTAKKRVYICPEESCVFHDPSRALSDLTGIKKHYSRKHGEKKWKCDKCTKWYAVRTDWKAHVRVCGTREYECACGTLFSRKDSFVVHRASCESLDDNDDGDERIDCKVRTNTVNSELLFPSLWGQSSSISGTKDEQRERC
ncbi:beta-beta-alpha zinc fingers domain-containing protein [Dioscorea alata]|uniref:Beta-beta-alpha zinc fingers domain-containing protein n=1 Tax=Dioscorea alata TaxID=55571 RepID=A0ACB7V343_DIOAL|nr:beta-beta-alpha zinc fingers domain-containing protein [Dioscorea alata]